MLSALAIAYFAVTAEGCSFAGEPWPNEQWGKYFYSGRDSFTKGHFSEAEKQFSLALKESQRVDPYFPSTQHGSQTESLAWLANACLKQGKFEQAESFCKQALKIGESASKPDNFDLIDRLTNLAEVYRSQRKYSNAEPLLRRALAICEKNFDEDLSKSNNWTGTPILAAGLINLAVVLQEQN